MDKVKFIEEARKRGIVPGVVMKYCPSKKPYYELHTVPGYDKWNITDNCAWVTITRNGRVRSMGIWHKMYPGVPDYWGEIVPKPEQWEFISGFHGGNNSTSGAYSNVRFDNSPDSFGDLCATPKLHRNVVTECEADIAKMITRAAADYGYSIIGHGDYKRYMLVYSEWSDGQPIIRIEPTVTAFNTNGRSLSCIPIGSFIKRMVQTGIKWRDRNKTKESATTTLKKSINDAVDQFIKAIGQ